MKGLASRSTWWHTLAHKSEPAVNEARQTAGVSSRTHDRAAAHRFDNMGVFP